MYKKNVCPFLLLESPDPLLPEGPGLLINLLKDYFSQYCLPVLVTMTKTGMGENKESCFRIYQNLVTLMSLKASQRITGSPGMMKWHSELFHTPCSKAVLSTAVPAHRPHSIDRLCCLPPIISVGFGFCIHPFMVTGRPS